MQSTYPIHPNRKQASHLRRIFFGALLVSLLLLFACAAAAEESSLYPLTFTQEEFILFDGFHLGMSEQELTEKIHYALDQTSLHSDVSKKLRYIYPPIGSMESVQVDFNFYEGKLNTLSFIREYTSDGAEEILLHFALLNEAFTKLYGPPSVVETNDYKLSKQYGKTIADTRKYDYVWDTKDQYRIIHDAISKNSSLTDSVFVMNLKTDIFQEADLEELADPNGLGYMIPKRGQPFLYGIKYGMTPDEVKALEPGIPLEGQIMSYDGMVYSHPGLFGFEDLKIEYEFPSGTKGTLGFVFYIFSMEDADKTLVEYERINRYLRTAYGIPLGDYIDWEEEVKDFDRSTFSKRLQNNQLSLYWFKDSYDQIINHRISQSGWVFAEGPIHFLEFTRLDPLSKAPEP